MAGLKGTPKRTLGSALLALALFFVALPQTSGQEGVLTDEERAYLGAHGPIIVAVNDGFAPFALLDDRSEVQGINADFLRLMSIRLGIQFDFVVEANFSSTLDAVQSGRADLTGNLALTPERERTMSFTQPYVWMNTVFWTREGNSLHPDFEGETIAMVTRTKTIATVKTSYPLANVLEVADVRDGLAALADGSADAFVGATAPTAYIIREEHLFNITPVGDAIEQSVFRFAVAKGEPQLVGIMDKGLASITPDERSAIFAKWTGTDLGQPPNH